MEHLSKWGMNRMETDGGTLAIVGSVFNSAGNSFGKGCHCGIVKATALVPTNTGFQNEKDRADGDRRGVDRWCRV